MCGFLPQSGSEAENDAAIAHMAERAGMLRSVTIDMQSEVDSQNRLLDSIVRLTRVVTMLESDVVERTPLMNLSRVV